MNIAAGILLSLQAVLLFQSVAASKSEVFPDPETLQYLENLYQRVKDLHRPLVEGEMNLLPEQVQGFANSVMCFSDLSATAVSDNSRTLQFNLSNSMTGTDRIAAIDLVLKQAPGASPYKTHLHEISGDETDMELKLLDSGEYDGEWHTLHVQNLVDSIDGASGKKNYKLLLSVSGGEDEGMDDLLQRVKPMLLIYTNDLNRTGEEPMADEGHQVMGRASAGSSRSKDSRSRSRQQYSTRRQRRRRDASEASSSSGLSLAQMKALSCRVQERRVTYQELGYPGSLHVVLSGTVTTFAFCYGTCNDPFSSAVNYTNHAKLIGLTLMQDSVAPCCVPNEFTPTPITYVSIFSSVITMTTYPNARSCQCM